MFFAFLTACHNPFGRLTGIFSFTKNEGYSKEKPLGVASNEAGWYIDKVNRACRPFYLRADVEPYKGNWDLPKTKDECDVKCGKSLHNVIFEKILNKALL